MRESVQVFIGRPNRTSCARGSRSRLRLRRGDRRRLEVAEQELAAQDEFAHRIVNDDLEQAADELEGIVRAELGLSLDSPAE